MSILRTSLNTSWSLEAEWLLRRNQVQVAKTCKKLQRLH
jgi:hypothetical protein